MYRTVTFGPSVSAIADLGAYRMRGAEPAVRQQLGRDWSVFSGYTLLDPSINNLPYAPEKALTLGVMVASGRSASRLTASTSPRFGR